MPLGIRPEGSCPTRREYRESRVPRGVPRADVHSVGHHLMGCDSGSKNPPRSARSESLERTATSSAEYRYVRKPRLSALASVQCGPFISRASLSCRALRWELTGTHLIRSRL